MEGEVEWEGEMGSVRERLERQLEKPEEIVRPVNRSSTIYQSGSGQTVRQRAERRESLETPDQIVKLDPHRSTGLTANHSYNESVRSRLDRERYAAEVTAEQPTVSDATEHYYRIYKAEQAEKAEREARELREQQERQARAAREEQERAEYNRKIVPINLVLGSAPGGPATPDERRRVLEAAQRRYSGLPTPSQALTILLVLRAAIG